MRAMGRVWPDGEATLWADDKVDFDMMDDAYLLGSSKVPNSQDQHQGMTEASSQRGLRGITRYGSRLVRNAAFVLQKVYGKERLSFCTTTIPGSPGETCLIAERWSEIVRRFIQAVKEKLERHQLPPYIVGVTEVQMLRFRRTGGMPLHLHMVFVGRHKGRGAPWEVSTKWFDACWRRAVVGVCPEVDGLNFRASCNMQRVRDSAKGYLGKYMSKGIGAITELLEQEPTLIQFIPRSWYACTNPLRNLVLRNVAYGADVGETLEGWTIHPRGGECLEWMKRHQLRAEDGAILAEFVCIQLTTYGRKMMGLPVSPWEYSGLEYPP